MMTSDERIEALEAHCALLQAALNRQIESECNEMSQKLCVRAESWFSIANDRAKRIAELTTELEEAQAKRTAELEARVPITRERAYLIIREALEETQNSQPTFQAVTIMKGIFNAFSAAKDDRDETIARLQKQLIEYATKELKTDPKPWDREAIHKSVWDLARQRNVTSVPLAISTALDIIEARYALPQGKPAFDVEKALPIFWKAYDEAKCEVHVDQPNCLIIPPFQYNIHAALEAVARELAPPLPASIEVTSKDVDFFWREHEMLRFKFDVKSYNYIDDKKQQENRERASQMDLGALQAFLDRKLVEAQPYQPESKKPYDAEAELESVRRERDEYRARFEALEREQNNLQANAYHVGHEQGQSAILVTDADVEDVREYVQARILELPSSIAVDPVQVGLMRFAECKNRELRTVRPVTPDDVREYDDFVYSDSWSQDLAFCAQWWNQRLGFPEVAE